MRHVIPCWILLGVLCLVPVARAAGGDPLSSLDGIFMRVGGTEELTCRSQWHNVKLLNKFTGICFVSREAFTRLSHDAGDGDISQETAAQLFGPVFACAERESNDPVAFERWRGDGLTCLPGELAAELDAQIMKVDDEEKEENVGSRAIALNGRLKLIERGRASTRYGPQQYEAKWDLSVKGRVSRPLQQPEVELTLSGTVAGAYSNENSPQKDPWDAEVELTVERYQLDSEAQGQLNTLIAELGHEDFARRDKATEEAKQLDPLPKMILLAMLDASDDPELQHRARLIAPERYETTEPEAPPQPMYYHNGPLLLHRRVRGMDPDPPVVRPQVITVD